MQILSIKDTQFNPFGKVVDGYDLRPAIDKLISATPKPNDHVVYVPGCGDIEALPVCGELRSNFFGGMPIQMGYCNGSNIRLDCLEYHKSSEVVVAADDVVLLVARLQDISHGKIPTDKVEAFLLLSGMAVELYATTLHYAPCNAPNLDSFRTIIILPKDTNTDISKETAKNQEDGMLWARNKWLLAHPDTSEAKNGAYVGISGDNIVLPNPCGSSCSKV